MGKKDNKTLIIIGVVVVVAVIAYLHRPCENFCLELDVIQLLLALETLT